MALKIALQVVRDERGAEKETRQKSRLPGLNVGENLKFAIVSSCHHQSFCHVKVVDAT